MLSPRAIFAASSGNAKGIAWMFLAGLIFVIVTGSVRHLSATIHPIQLAFLRYAIALIFLAPVFWRGIRSYRNRPHRYGLHIARGLLQAVGVMLWFYAMANIPVAEVTALGFTAPIFATIGAALFLGEKLYMRRISAVLFGFAGAMVILQPGFKAIELGAIAQLAAAPLFAATLLIGKRLTETESNGTIVAALGLVVTIALFPPGTLRVANAKRRGNALAVRGRRPGHPRPPGHDTGLSLRRGDRPAAYYVPATGLGQHVGFFHILRGTGYLDLDRRWHHRRLGHIYCP